jgi:quercetin dioxygenase-like cupin family protein
MATKAIFGSVKKALEDRQKTGAQRRGLRTNRFIRVGVLAAVLTLVPVNPDFFFGWHYHNGPVIVTVTAGTLTYFDASCNTWDVTAGHSYIESTGQVLNVTTVPAKNDGVATVEWFTTRLYPEGATDPVNVDPPCTP